MRIIAGTYRGRTLVAPKGEVTRPTADRMREALFSMLTSRLGGFGELRVADLFAGSGALGLEALSRGAAHCTFVEHDAAAVTALRTNIAKLGVERSSDVRIQSAMTLGPVPQPYDLVLLDPPYATGAGMVALERLMRLGWLAAGTLVSLETAKAEDDDVAALEKLASRVHGKAKITLFRVA